jgi:hypothetical protein
MARSLHPKNAFATRATWPRCRLAKMGPTFGVKDMPTQPWRDWYHCMVGTYGQWLPGDPRGWHERHHHEHVPCGFARPPEPTPFAQARLDWSRRIMKWHPYLFLPQDRKTVGLLLLESFYLQQLPGLALAVGATHFHALLKIADHNPKRALGIAKRHVTFEFAPIIDRATNKRQQIWEGDAGVKPIRDREHAMTTLHYILHHAREGAWVASYRDHPQFARPLP